MEPIPREVVWLVSFVLIEAAIIDGRSLRVPNWLTYHFLVGGLIFAFLRGGSPLLLISLAGAGGRPDHALAAVCDRRDGGRRREADGRPRGLDRPLAHGLGVRRARRVAGALMAVGMIVYSGAVWRHLAMMHTIGHEVLSIRNPVVLSERAAERKPTMLLLPYAIPIAAGSIAYFAGTGLLDVNGGTA